MLNAFFAGKGFYIVLLLCAVLVGACSGWLDAEARADVERDPVKETNITASAQETAPPQGSRYEHGGGRASPRSARARPARRGGEMPEAQAPRRARGDAGRSGIGERESAPQFIRPVNGVFASRLSVRRRSPMTARWPTGASTAAGTSHAAAGEPVLAVSGGTVTAVHEDDLLGTVVEINHGTM